MKIAYFLRICVFVLMASCTKKDDPIIDLIIDEPNPIPENAINLSDLKAGQQSFFVKYISTCDSLEEKFEYTRDTLIVEVVEQGGMLLLKEHYTKHSPMYLDTLIFQTNRFFTLLKE